MQRRQRIHRPQRHGPAGLGERDRQIIHMRFVEELTQAQIGEHLGVSQM
ncbi:sigma factor-like helix-turn-helix DNA-binding protein, partial [Streptomyces sp. NPDC052127]